ncbi:citrate synthase [Brachybacterium alimentarium]|uniref:Citrate synthase n=1 Tax=Brachybacterium alimentarium TaxID=47845 RepID=A0A2A3YHH1_9MICO|nr:citrate synthase [Brachybacterium alimentarium]PCC34959.1 citrate (Si)-synthase [Brachybacterium alimentarium]PCC38744.1 citrate (Si)-synthase [Brachybacterium alimentarium]RCS76087.1 citrate synthase [Brachybacterium alimentarium]RCS80395.1 citrate synthase [Brachybacterium alimentarium]RCS83004.1 citrate synthase [Brachybacterium alimentarium]
MDHATSAQLTLGEKSLDLPIVPSVEGNSGISIGPLRKETGEVTYDPGFMNTANAKSSITYIDGDEGILRYRGYPIEQLAENSSFLEVSYLLINGELPTTGQLDNFVAQVERRTLLDERFKRMFDGYPRDAHPMAVLQAGVSGLSTFYQDSLDPFDEEQTRLSTVRLLAKMPTMAAYAHRLAQGHALLYPDNRLSLIENFLRLTFGFPVEDYIADPVVVRAMEQLLILHADHEQNCSTSAVRLVGSAQANLFTSISAGIGALSGPAHGGANAAVMDMLDQIQTENMDPRDFMEKVKNKEDGIRLMGFGHRVYKNYDPRARIVKKIADNVLERLGVHDERLELAMKLEEIALQDDYFVERKLYPNVDFYTGLIYKAIGFPTEMFTVLFAIGRLPGWIAQWQEMVHDPETKIGRPRQIYTGHAERPYVPMEDRTGTSELRLAELKAELDNRD